MKTGTVKSREFKILRWFTLKLVPLVFETHGDVKTKHDLGPACPLQVGGPGQTKVITRRLFFFRAGKEEEEKNLLPFISRKRILINLGLNGVLSLFNVHI